MSEPVPEDWWERAVRKWIAAVEEDARPIAEHAARRHNTISGTTDASGVHAAHLRHHHYGGPMIEGDDHSVDDLAPTRYVVIRPAPDLPAGFLPADLDGYWYDRRLVMPVLGTIAVPTVPMAPAVATGRFERREDGALAEVYEVRR